MNLARASKRSGFIALFLTLLFANAQPTLAQTEKSALLGGAPTSGNDASALLVQINKIFLENSPSGQHQHLFVTNGELVFVQFDQSWRKNVARAYAFDLSPETIAVDNNGTGSSIVIRSSEPRVHFTTFTFKILGGDRYEADTIKEEQGQNRPFLYMYFRSDSLVEAELKSGFTALVTAIRANQTLSIPDNTGFADKAGLLEDFASDFRKNFEEGLKYHNEQNALVPGARNFQKDWDHYDELIKQNESQRDDMDKDWKAWYADSW